MSVSVSACLPVTNQHEFIITIIIWTLNSDAKKKSLCLIKKKYIKYPPLKSYISCNTSNHMAKSQQLYTATLQYIHTNLVSFRINIHTRIRTQSSEQVKRIEQTSDYTINTPFSFDQQSSIKNVDLFVCVRERLFVQRAVFSVYLSFARL